MTCRTSSLAHVFGITIALAGLGAGSAMAQTTEATAPTVAITTNFDVPSVYVFRGLVQEADPSLTMFPSVDAGVVFDRGDKPLRTVSLNAGTWHSLHTGTSGREGASGRLHYEQDFYATVGFGFGRGISLSTTYTAYTSPNDSFRSVHEVAVKASKAHALNPYGLVAFELNGAADGIDDGTGTYVELGVGPSVPLPVGKVTLTLPVKVGLSANDYYQGLNGDKRFGYLDVGGLVTLPLSAIPSTMGSWNVHAGADLYLFGDTTRAFNAGVRTRLVFVAGLGLVY